MPRLPSAFLPLFLFLPSFITKSFNPHKPDPNHQIHLTFILHLQTLSSTIVDHIHTVSDPQSHAYGRYLSQNASQMLFQPRPSAISFMHTLSSRFGSHNVYKHSSYGDQWRVVLSIKQAETLLETELFFFHHHSRSIIRPREFTVPHSMTAHILYIDGLFLHRAQIETHSIYSSQSSLNSHQHSQSVTPGQIRAYYRLPNIPSAPHKVRFFLSSFLNERFDPSDVKLFQKRFSSSQRHSIISPQVRGDCIASDQNATGEASLDIQVAVSISQSPLITFQCDQTLREADRAMSDDNQEPFLRFFREINNLEVDKRPSVISISYSDDECAVPKAYANAVNRELQKLTLKGVTVVVAAGDAGVQGSEYAASFCNISACSQKNAMFPASSPFVLSVGATTLSNGIERVTSTENGDLITSGGGLSRLFEQPAYQRRLNFSEYTSDSDSDSETNSTQKKEMRAYPDLTAIGHGFPVIVNGREIQMDGTSVSAPIVASMIVLINEWLLKRKAPAVGFINPLLYQLYDVCPHVFTDILKGNNRCGKSGMMCCARGYEAKPNFDLVSGLGSLRVQAFLESYEECMRRIHSKVDRDDVPRTVFLDNRIGMNVEPNCIPLLLLGMCAVIAIAMFVWQRIRYRRPDPATERLLSTPSALYIQY